MDKHPDLLPQQPIVERLVSVMPDLHIPMHNQDLPKDEREWARDGDWLSFSEREKQLQRIRKVKAARIVLRELGIYEDDLDDLPAIEVVETSIETHDFEVGDVVLISPQPGDGNKAWTGFPARVVPLPVGLHVMPEHVCLAPLAPRPDGCDGPFYWKTNQLKLAQKLEGSTGW